MTCMLLLIFQTVLLGNNILLPEMLTLRGMFCFTPSLLCNLDAELMLIYLIVFYLLSSRLSQDEDCRLCAKFWQRKEVLTMRIDFLNYYSIQHNTQQKNHWPSVINTWDLGIINAMLYQLSKCVRWKRAVDFYTWLLYLWVFSSNPGPLKSSHPRIVERWYGNQFWLTNLNRKLAVLKNKCDNIFSKL